VSYFRPQKAGKIGPRTVHSFSDSTSRLSQKAGQVKTANCNIVILSQEWGSLPCTKMQQFESGV
jgi:hypothetical protein